MSIMICSGAGSGVIGPTVADPQSSSAAKLGDPVRRGHSAPLQPSRRTGSPGHVFAFGFDAAAMSPPCAPKLQRRRQAGRRQRVGRRVLPYPRPPLAKSPRDGYIGRARLRRASGTNISPGPYRSFRELSLARSVDLDIWCPPTFVGNSGIERFNGDCGFALRSLPSSLYPHFPVLIGCRSPAFLRTFDRPPSAGLPGGHVACR
ncbi:hypothetical protein ACVIJ6_003148 [Bradyrhizobium sp. USDA 4369]